MSEQVFHDIIYKVRGSFWKDHKCGSGSLLENTANVREHLPLIVDKFQIRSILDAPCGDYSWMQHTVFPGNMQYIGGDIVGKMIDENKSQYPNVNFIKLDITADELPAVDLLFCRDLLIHLPLDSIKKLLLNFLRSNIKYILISSYDNDSNSDIGIGQHHPINLQKQPFLFPDPLYTINDSCIDATRNMMLWHRDNLTACINNWSV